MFYELIGSPDAQQLFLVNRQIGDVSLKTSLIQGDEANRPTQYDVSKITCTYGWETGARRCHRCRGDVSITFGLIKLVECIS